MKQRMVETVAIITPKGYLSGGDETDELERAKRGEPADQRGPDATGPPDRLTESRRSLSPFGSVRSHGWAGWRVAGSAAGTRCLYDDRARLRSRLPHETA